MSETEKYLKLIEIASAEYMDKHHHFWNIYWRFLTGLAFTMGLYVFGEKNLDSYIQTSRIVTTVVFCIIILLMGVVSFRVLIREHTYLLQISKRSKNLYAKLGVEPFPEIELYQHSKLEKFYKKDFSIASTLAISILVVLFLCFVLIILSSFVIVF